MCKGVGGGGWGGGPKELQRDDVSVLVGLARKPLI